MVTKSMGTKLNAPPPSPPAAPFADPASRAVLDDIRRIVRALRESSRSAEQRVGLSGAQLFVLRCLADSPVLSLNELAARTLTHQSSVSVVVSRLVRRGLVTRTRADGDGRRTEIALTASGRAVCRRAPIAAQDRLIAALARLTPVGRRQLARQLARLVEAMSLPDERALMFFEPDSTRPRKGRESRRSREGEAAHV